MHRRVIMIVAGALVYLFALVSLFTATIAVIATGGEDWFRAIGDLIGEPGWWLGCAIFAALFIGSQLLFLLPIFRFRPPTSGRRKSLKFSLVMTVFVGGFLSIALFGAMLELGGSIFTTNYVRSPWKYGGDLLDQHWLLPIASAALVFSWLLWSVIIFVFSRQLWADKALGRWIGILLGGTFIELGIIIPIDVMVRRRTDCYCATGTFWSLCIASLAIFWLSGPGMYIAITSKRRRMFRERHCVNCGQAKGPTPGEKCPECGYAW